MLRHVPSYDTFFLLNELVSVAVAYFAGRSALGLRQMREVGREGDLLEIESGCTLHFLPRRR